MELLADDKAIYGTASITNNYGAHGKISSNESIEY